MKRGIAGRPIQGSSQQGQPLGLRCILHPGRSFRNYVKNSQGMQEYIHDTLETGEGDTLDTEVIIHARGRGGSLQ